MMDGEIVQTDNTPSQQSPAVSSNGRTSDFGSDNSGSSPEAATTENTNVQDKPAGFEQVEFTPEQKARVDRIYGNMKRYENDLKEQRLANQLLIERFGELAQNQEKVVNYLQTSDFQDAETRLQSDRDAAWQAGDVKSFNAANDKLMEVKLQKKLAEQPRPQKEQQNQPLQPNRAISATEALEMSVQKGETPPDEAPVLRAYFSETDETGNLKRPWVNVSDVRNTQAARVAAVVFDPEHPTFGNWSLKQKLGEVDRQMGVKSNQQTGGQAVLGSGNLTGPRKNNTVKLSPTEEQIAIRTKFGGPKAKSDEDHREAYRQAKMKSQAKRSR